MRHLWVLFMGLAALASTLIVMLLSRQHSEPFVSVEGFTLHEDEAFDETARAFVNESANAARLGDLGNALKWMRKAVVYQSEREEMSNFELWDNLAELYCANAAAEGRADVAVTLRAKGLALLREFKCAIDIWDGRLCRDVPNREGLCFKAQCELASDGTVVDRWASFRDAEPPPGAFSWHTKDGANLPAIMNLCTRSR